jgi:hypothetical protein
MWRLKLYAVAAGAFLLAILRALHLIKKGEREKIEAKRASRRVEASKEARRIEDDVESDPYLVDRARSWVRKDD